MNNNIDMSVAWLDGYLSGLAAYDGDIRERTAYAFLTVSKDESATPAGLIQDRFAAQIHLQISHVQKLGDGLGELERLLSSHYLITRPLGISQESFPHQLIDERRRLIAFRIMDAIDKIAPKASEFRTVYKIESQPGDAQSEATFFSIKIESGFLVLQFNDNTPFINSVK